jgi:hypothetical protein
VLLGIVIEPAFTIALFVYDESISREQNTVIREQNSKIITLETKLEQATDLLLRQSMDRWLSFNWGACTKLIDEKRTTKVEIVWLKTSPDARRLADRIASCLVGSDGMSETKPASIDSVDAMPDEAEPSGVTVMGKAGGMWQLNTDAPADFIMKALTAGMEKVPSGIRFSHNGALPNDIVRVVVGPR